MMYLITLASTTAKASDIVVVVQLNGAVLTRGGGRLMQVLVRLQEGTGSMMPRPHPTTHHP